MANPKIGKLISVSVTLEIESLAGGFPGSIDAYRAYLQSPALAARVPADVREAFIASEPLPAEVPTDDETIEGLGTVVRTGFRRLPDGRAYIAPHQVKACLQQACEACYGPKTNPSIYTMSRAVKRNLEILPAQIVLEDATPEHEETINQIIAHPRREDIKVPSIRKRQVIDHCRVSFTALIVNLAAGAALVDELDELLQVAGITIGLGTDRGYEHGRFSVKELVWGQASKNALSGVRFIGEEGRKGIDPSRASPD